MFKQHWQAAFPHLLIDQQGVMGRQRRSRIIYDSLDDRVVTFPDDTAWQLTKQICEKPWEGSFREKSSIKEPEANDSWSPSEAHGVYECMQVQGPQLGTVAIMKIRIEY